MCRVTPCSVRSPPIFKSYWPFPSVFPVNSIRALRAVIAAERAGKGGEAMRALFPAYWVEGEDISDAQVIERALNAVGLEGKALVAATDSQEVKDALRKNTDLALSRGVFGVPTLFVGERSFWGNDRLHFAEQELSRSR